MISQIQFEGSFFSSQIRTDTVSVGKGFLMTPTNACRIIILNLNGDVIVA